LTYSYPLTIRVAMILLNTIQKYLNQLITNT